MNLCSDGHEEVCFEGRDCPACTIREELQPEIDALKEKVESLEDEINSMEE